MIRFLFVRMVVPLLIFWLLRGIVRSVIAGNSRPIPKPARPASTVPAGGELRKDPVCGTYVAEAASVTKRVNGEVLHFCSAVCRDKYRAA